MNRSVHKELCSPTQGTTILSNLLTLMSLPLPYSFCSLACSRSVSSVTTWYRSLHHRPPVLALLVQSIRSYRIEIQVGGPGLSRHKPCPPTWISILHDPTSEDAIVHWRFETRCKCRIIPLIPGITWFRNHTWSNLKSTRHSYSTHEQIRAAVTLNLRLSSHARKCMHLLIGPHSRLSYFCPSRRSVTTTPLSYL